MPLVESMLLSQTAKTNRPITAQNHCPFKKGIKGFFFFFLRIVLKNYSDQLWSNLVRNMYDYASKLFRSVRLKRERERKRKIETSSPFMFVSRHFQSSGPMSGQCNMTSSPLTISHILLRPWARPCAKHVESMF